jgi:hypothetical protein
MLSPRPATAVLALGFVLFCSGTARADQDRANPQEVIQRVQQAAQDLASRARLAWLRSPARTPPPSGKTATPSS